MNNPPSHPLRGSGRPAGRAWRALALTLAALALTAATAGCQKTQKSKKDGAGSAATAEAAGSAAGSAGGAGTLIPAVARGKDIDSKDIMARTEVAEISEVKHVLVAWKELESAYGGQMDPRAKTRTNDAAAKLAQELAEKLRAAPDSIDALVKEHSEDPGSREGNPYTVRDDGQFMPEFTKLSLRLKIKEVGIVQTSYGYHVIERVPPPPPDPIESSEILRRASHGESVFVRHILIAWKDAPAARRGMMDDRAKDRTKAQADEMVLKLAARVAKGEDIVKLMAEFSEDPGSAKNGRPYPVSEGANMVPPFKNLSMRLKLDESGVVKTDFGWHIIKRIAPPPPPPPDKLESVEILSRATPAAKTKVKHILLGWKETNAGDERGKKRTRAELEALVKKTVAALQKGDKIEPLMAELSEDQGSAKSGDGYDVTPDAGLVEPFKNLSLRLNLKEVGVVKTDFGIHIIQRVE
ncbi:MAG TPA: peptidylprolyl isomerase [Kofleriaceae bacterium]|nr:peptidylprolyl isomerase [Kofleriaceae bacterium]